MVVIEKGAFGLPSISVGQLNLPVGIIEYLSMVWETRVHSLVESYQKLKKWYLLLHCLTLSIIRYESKLSGAIQGKEWHPPLHLSVVALGKEAFMLTIVT